MADNELTVTNGNNFSANGTNAVSHFFDTSTMDGKMALYNAMQTADKVDEHLNEPLHVTNVLAQAIEVANQETGEINSSTRVVIHAEEGDFAAASPTLAHAFGNPIRDFRNAGHVESPACSQGGGKEESPWIQVLRP